MFRWIMYTAQNTPGNMSFDLNRVGSIADARARFDQFCRATGNDDSSARLYGYTEEDWAEAVDFQDAGCPFDYPGKIIERGPRGGVRVINA